MSGSRTDFSAIQALRGIAAFWVVLFHLREGHHIDQLTATLPHAIVWLLFELGDNGVAIFFALSGFVIAHSIRTMSCTAGYLGRFMLRRSIRLDPPYWTSMVVVVALAATSAWVKGEGFELPTTGQLGAHVFYLQMLLGQPLISSVYWTLTFEVQFYLVLVTMLAVAGVRREWAIRIMTVLAAVAALGAFKGVPSGLFLERWHQFFIGALAYWAITEREKLPLALFVGALMLPFDTFSRVSAITALGLLLLGRLDRLETALSWRPLLWLGTISYSLYLFHNPITGASAFLMRRVVGEGVLPDLGIALCATALALIFSTATWVMIERPSQALARRVTLKQTPAASPSPKDTVA